MNLEELFQDALPVQKAGDAHIMPEELESILDILKFGDHLLKIVSASFRERRVDEMPDQVDDEADGSDAVEYAADIEAFFQGKERLEYFKFVKEERETGDYQYEKSNDQNKVLHPLGPVHPDEHLIIPDQRCIFSLCLRFLWFFISFIHCGALYGLNGGKDLKR